MNTCETPEDHPHCKFGDTLDDMLHDRLVCGCCDKRLQYKLLADLELTYEKAIAIVCTYSRNGGLRALLHFSVGEFRVKQLLRILPVVLQLLHCIR